MGNIRFWFEGGTADIIDEEDDAEMLESFRDRFRVVFYFVPVHLPHPCEVFSDKHIKF